MSESSSQNSEVEKSNLRVAFVLGNGISRKSISLKDLENFGIIYGCNALYREFAPDHLICVDPKMVLEVSESGFQNDYNVWTNYNSKLKDISNLNFFQPKLGWSSGPSALYLACQHNNNEIYILGFDYKGLNNGTYINNIYADTKNYKKSRDRATFYGNWLSQTKKTVEKNKDKNFYRVIQENDFVSEDLKNQKNLKHVLIKDFKDYFNIN